MEGHGQMAREKLEDQERMGHRQADGKDSARAPTLHRRRR